MTRGFFVTGTDTGVGKTLISCALLRAAGNAGLRTAGMKPVAAGCRQTSSGLRNEDAEALLAASNVQAAYEHVNPVALPLATSPALAAREAGREIRIELITAAFLRLASRADFVIVEGAGGWYTPIAPDKTMADVARALNLPVLLVVGMRLGCLSHARLTVEAIARSGLPLAGLIANHAAPEACDPGYISALAAQSSAPLLARIAYDPKPELERFTQALGPVISLEG